MRVGGIQEKEKELMDADSKVVTEGGGGGGRGNKGVCGNGKNIMKTR